MAIIGVVAIILVMVILLLVFIREPVHGGLLEVTFKPGITHDEAASIIAKYNCTILSNFTLINPETSEIHQVFQVKVPVGEESKEDIYADDFRQEISVYEVEIIPPIT